MNLKRTIEEIRQTRKNIFKVGDELSLDQLNKIPPGFNNNVAWNMGHIIASQQILCYKLAGLPMYADAAFIEKYKKGSKPEDPLTEKEFNDIREMSADHLDKLAVDLNQQRFDNYSAYETSYGLMLSNIHDVLQFLKMHEAMHLGYIMAQRRALG